MMDAQSYKFEFSNLSGEQTKIPLNQADVLFILGANGAGKSGLVHSLYSQNAKNAKRISAHRQTWFTSNTMDFTPTNKSQTEVNMRTHDTMANARWMDQHVGQRSQIIIFDLINSQNQRARKIADAVDNEDIALAKKLGKKEAPLKALNRLLQLSNLPIEISVEKDEKVFASKNGSDLYSIAELSDGERNAILIASDVLTAKENTLFVIDEPERHLHRSIISPLLSSLFQKRSDCTFVIATHDISLSLDNPEANILLVRECKWQGSNITGWDTDLITSADDIDYQIKQNILGNRRILLFVEGTESSLDLHIYQILFPEASVIPQGSCRGVGRAVHGLSSTESLQWIRALGIVDADDRTTADIDTLKSKNIYALPCYSVESIYYCLEMIEHIAKKSAELHGDNDGDLVTAAKSALIDAVKPHKERLCARLCERKIKEQIVSPDWQKICKERSFSIDLDLALQLKEENDRFDGYILNEDIALIISRYPIRETSALGGIAKALNFSNRKNYEAAVRKILIDDEEVRSQIKSKFGDLVGALSEDTIEKEPSSDSKAV